MAENRIVAVGLLTQEDVERVGDRISRLYAVDDEQVFADLLRAIDRADQAWRDRQGPA